MSHTAAMARLKHDRDRFVGFAFAGADALLELNREGVVSCALGAVASVFEIADDLADRAFHELFAPDDRAEIRAALAHAESKGLMKPLLVRALGPLGPAPVRLGAVSGRDGLKVSVTLLPASAEAAAGQGARLLGMDAFAEEVAKRLSEAGADAKRSLTMIELQGLKTALAGDPAEREHVLAAIGAVMLDHAEGGLAAQLGPDRFGLLSRDEDAAKAALDDIAKAAPDGVALSARDLPADAGTLSAQDMRSALLYVVRQFADEGLAETPSTLGGGFQQMLTTTMARVDALRSKLASGVKLVYQPISRLLDGAVVHHEVLSRFDGKSSPQRDIAFAENLGMVGELDLVVARMALERLEKGCSTPLAVNVSARSLASDAFVQAFFALMTQNPNLRSRLMVELTETAEIKDLARAAKILGDLKAAGQAVCIDDFGGGAASLAYLRALPARYLKIDGLYVDGLPGSLVDRAIVRAIAQLSKEIGLTTVAERVELREQAHMLTMLGVDLGQGWLFGKPALAPLGSDAAGLKAVLAGARR
jgi:EAL domain-containing protein (putative c-di-GMP-specific phosphodiesterase class I)